MFWKRFCSIDCQPPGQTNTGVRIALSRRCACQGPGEGDGTNAAFMSPRNRGSWTREDHAGPAEGWLENWQQMLPGLSILQESQARPSGDVPSLRRVSIQKPASRISQLSSRQNDVILPDTNLQLYPLFDWFKDHKSQGVALGRD